MDQSIGKKLDHSEILGRLSVWFPQTDWTMIEDPTFLDRVKKLIAEKYWGPLYFFLIRKGCSDDEANEILQRFFLKSILSAKLIQQADRNRGKFRSLLIIALQREMYNYMIEMGKLPSPLPVNLNEKQEINDTAHDKMTLLWTTNLVNTVISQVKETCYKDGLGIHWEIFSEMVLNPVMKEKKAPSRTSMCHKYSLNDESKVSNMALTVKRRFRQTLTKEIRRYVSSDIEVDEEIKDLINILLKF